MQRKLFFLACILFSVHGFGQQYPFVHYTPNDGLVNSRVRKAYQDSKGRMYFITYGGLSVYDGARFKNYTAQNGLTNGLVNDVLEIGDDSLLVAVNTCGMNMLVRGQMKRINKAGRHCPVINNFLKSEDGSVYAASDDGLYRLKENSFEKLPASLPGENEMLAYLGALTEYKDFLIFGRNDLRNYTGLFLYNKKTASVADAMPGQYIKCLKKDLTGIIWISTDKQVYNLDTAALQEGKLAFRKPYASFVNITDLKPGNIIFNLQNEPLIAVEKNIIRYRKDGTQLRISLPEQGWDSPRDIFSDREDILWISHDGNGIFKLPGTKLQLSVSYLTEDGSGINLLDPVSPDSCWVVTKKNRLSLYTSSGSKNFYYTPSFTINAVYWNKKYLYAVEKNKLYMAPLPAAGEPAIRFRPVLTCPDTSAFGEQYINDPYGNLILFESRSICVLQNDKLLFTRPLDIYDLIEGMHIDKNNQLWVVSRGNGLQVFSLHPENPSAYLQKKQHFLKEFEKASPRSATVDQNEMLWVGSRYDGLMAFEYTGDTLIKRFHFQTANGLTDNFVTALTIDRNNNIVAGTQTGLDRLIRIKDNNYRIENVTKSNNIFSYINTVWTDTADVTFALTNSGTVLQATPVQNEQSQQEPQLLMEELRINGKSFQQHPSPLRLKYNQRNITFSLAAPTFIDEKQVKFSYLLSGSGNNNWSDTTTAADITLLNLPPGNYSLHVKAFFASAPYSPKELFFAFSIMPPWWQTWWFRIPGGLLFMGLLIIAFRFYYRRKLEKQKIILEKQQAVEKERTRIATDMHDDLGAGLSRIKFLSETIGLKKQQQQPIDEDIMSIREYSHEMIGKMGEIVWALNEKNDSLNDLFSYTRSYAVEYLSQNGIACKIIVPEHVPEHYVTGEFRRNIYLSVKEALHNIVKHAQAKQVIITIKTGKYITISIHDDGIGYSGNHTPYSNGIMNMRQRMKNINGEFEIESNKGTTIKLSAPVMP